MCPQTMTADSTHQNLLPSDLSPVSGQTRGKRACTECSRKKSKCNMILPECSLCVKAGSTCIYPTTRKPRSHGGRRKHHLRMYRSNTLVHLDQAQQATQETLEHQSNRSDLTYSDIPHDLSEDLTQERRRSRRNAPFVGSFDMFVDAGNSILETEENVRQEASPQQSTGSAAHTHGSNNNNIRTGDMACDASMTDSSQTLIPPQSSPPGDLLSANFEAQGTFNRFSLPYFGLNIFNRDFQAADIFQSGSSTYDDWNSSNIDWHSLLPEAQVAGGPEMGLSQNTSSQLLNSEILRETSNVSKNLYEVDIPESLIAELIEIFFDKIQGYLPLFHKPRFMQSDFLSLATNNPQLTTLETSFILHGMLALSARFSSAPIFDGVKPSQKGDRFGQRAKAIYDDSIGKIQQPNLRYLQGCILLGFYLYSCEPDFQGWLVIGNCSRLAHELGLNKIDKNNRGGGAVHTTNSLEWSKREEFRRAWWCVWELDTFASAISCRPYAIDSLKMQVLLPVSDDAWFANTPVKSAMLDPNPLAAWQTLRDCPNQDERAWFLVLNFLVLIASDLGEQSKPNPKSTKDIATAIACFRLLMPPQFHLDSGSILFNSEHFRKSNVIISANIMLQGCQTFVRFISEKASLDMSSSSENHLLAPLAAGSKFGAPEMDYRPYSEQVYQCIRQWSPEYIPYNSPFIGCLILGPAAIHMRVAKALGSRTDLGRKSLSLEAELLKLALGHVARYWGIGSAILDLANMVANATPLDVPNSL